MNIMKQKRNDLVDKILNKVKKKLENIHNILKVQSSEEIINSIKSNNQTIKKFLNSLKYIIQENNNIYTINFTFSNLPEIIQKIEEHINNGNKNIEKILQKYTKVFESMLNTKKINPSKITKIYEMFVNEIDINSKLVQDNNNTYSLSY